MYFMWVHRFWVLRMHFILCFAFWPLVFILPETYGPTILKRRARALRVKGNLHAYSHEELEHAKLGDIAKIHLLRPLSELIRSMTTYVGLTQSQGMLLYEPICQGSAIWIGLAYGIM